MAAFGDGLGEGFGEDWGEGLMRDWGKGLVRDWGKGLVRGVLEATLDRDCCVMLCCLWLVQAGVDVATVVPTCGAAPFPSADTADTMEQRQLQEEAGTGGGSADVSPCPDSGSSAADGGETGPSAAAHIPQG